MASCGPPSCKGRGCGSGLATLALPSESLAAAEEGRGGEESNDRRLHDCLGETSTGEAANHSWRPMYECKQIERDTMQIVLHVQLNH